MVNTCSDSCWSCGQHLSAAGVNTPLGCKLQQLICLGSPAGRRIRPRGTFVSARAARDGDGGPDNYVGRVGSIVQIACTRALTSDAVISAARGPVTGRRGPPRNRPESRHVNTMLTPY